MGEAGRPCCLAHGPSELGVRDALHRRYRRLQRHPHHLSEDLARRHAVGHGDRRRPVEARERERVDNQLLARRLLEVLNTRLRGREYLVGDAFSIADIATYPWARAYPWANVSVDGLDDLKAWFDRIDARPAVGRALEKPKAVPAFWGQADEAAFLAENAARFAGDVRAS